MALALSSTARTRSACAIVLAGAVLLGARPAHADDATREAARQAYDRGAAAYDAGDYAKATSELTRADDLSASDVALELALKAAVRGDDALAAMTLAARADRRTKTPSVVAAAQAARAKMAGRTGTVNVTCPGYTSCAAKLDGNDVPAGEPQIVLVGAHRVIVQGAGGQRQAYDVRVDPDAALAVKALPPAPVAVLPPPAGPAPVSPASDSAGISPAWFFVGLGVTAVVGGLAIASGLDTKSKHEEFQTRPSEDLQQSGLDAQLRTNLLVGGTAFAGAVTAVLAVFTRWSSSPSTSAAKAAY